MAMQDRSANAIPGQRPSGLAAPIVVIPVLALIVNLGVFALARSGTSVVIPIEIIAGFTYRLAPLTPLLEALILGFGLWCYADVAIGRAGLAAIYMLILRIVVAGAVTYGLSIATSLMSDAMLTRPESAYLPPFVSTAFSGASLMFILSIYDARFRSWWAWILTILIWAGGTVLLFGLFRSQVVLASYPWLAQGARALGFIVIGYYFQQPRRRPA